MHPPLNFVLCHSAFAQTWTPAYAGVTMKTGGGEDCGDGRFSTAC